MWRRYVYCPNLIRSSILKAEVKMDELDLTSVESKAAYGEIKEYVLEHSGMKVSGLYICSG